MGNLKRSWKVMEFEEFKSTNPLTDIVVVGYICITSGIEDCL